MISSAYRSFDTFWGDLCSNTIVGFNIYVQAGAVNRKKKKPKMKSYTRRSHEPVDQSTTGLEELLRFGSGKGMCSVCIVVRSVNQNNFTVNVPCNDIVHSMFS